MIDDVFFKGKYVWNGKKAKDNIKKHNISFEDASKVFDSPFRILEYDNDNSVFEDRYNMIASTNGTNCITVSFTTRGEFIRIYSARDADSLEEIAYANNVRAHIGTR